MMKKENKQRVLREALLVNANQTHAQSDVAYLKPMSLLVKLIVVLLIVIRNNCLAVFQNAKICKLDTVVIKK